MLHEDEESMYCGGGNCAERLNGVPKVRAESEAKSRILVGPQPWVPRGSPTVKCKQGD